MKPLEPDQAEAVHMVPASQVRARGIPWADDPVALQPRNCPDCGAKPGHVHTTMNCDVQRCSACGGQRFSCFCHGKHDPVASYWTGWWPGELEARALGIDLTEFHRQGYPKYFFKKPRRPR